MKRPADVLGPKTGPQRGRSAHTNHRNSKKKASIGENVAHMTHIGHKWPVFVEKSKSFQKFMIQEI